jgi:alkylation response protein AidB-like acyl-CoA dehydrogenase
MQIAATSLERAKALYDLISAEAREAELAGRLTDRTARALLDANLFSMLVARSNGGLEASRSEFFETVEAVAKADGSAGWCLSVCATTAFVVSKAASAEVKREVFGDGPVALWTSLLPRAQSVAAEGGYRVSGRFGWGSGSSFAHWVVVAEGLPDRDGKQWFRAYVAPKSDVDCDFESWKPMGLEATASIDYSICDKFVPIHRSFEYPFLQPETSGTFSTMLGAFLNQVGLTAFAAGVGARALSELLAAAPKIRRTLGEGTQAEDSVVQHGISEHDGRLRAARAHYLNLLSAQDRHIAAHGAPSPAISLDLQQGALILTRAARDLTVFTFDFAGTNAVMRSDPLQRCLRDIFAGLKHVAFTPGIHARIGKARLGLGVPVVRLR